MFRRPSPAMVVACIALVISLGGTSYAAVQLTGADIRDNSLTSSDIRNGSLTEHDLKPDSLTSASIREGSLLASDFASGQLPSGQRGEAGPQGSAGPVGATGATGPRGDTGFTGPVGRQGLAGPEGPQGPQGPAGVTSVQYARSPVYSLPDGVQGFADVACDDGLVSVGGGAVETGDLGASLNSSFPAVGDGTAAPGDTGWGVFANNQSGVSELLQVYAICAPASSTQSPSQLAAATLTATHPRAVRLKVARP